MASKTKIVSYERHDELNIFHELISCILEKETEITKALYEPGYLAASKC